MTPDQLISIVRNRVRKGIHEEVIRFGIGRAYSVFMSQQKDLTSYRKIFEDVRIVENESRDNWYSLLPSNFLNIKDPIRIASKKGTKMEFTRVRDGEGNVYGELQVGQVSDLIEYVLRVDRVIYKKMNPAITEVDMYIIIPFESYDFDEEMLMPEEYDELLVQTAVDFIMGTPMSMNYNDSNEQTV